VAQWVLFAQCVEREIAWFYPSGYDQAVYLTKTYELSAAIQRDGAWTAIANHLQAPTANGVLMPLQAALFQLCAGPSRLAALAVNFFYFALFQASLVSLLRWMTRSWTVAYLGLGVCWMTSAFYWSSGGMLDFRIDCVAMCLFGTFLCAVVRSRILASRRWSVAAGLVGGLLVCFRFLTVVYLGGVLGALAFFVLIRWWLRRAQPDVRAECRRQAIGGALLALTIAATVGPLLWAHRLDLYNYYVVGHLLNAEKEVRAREFGVVDAWTNLTYYPSNILDVQLGRTFVRMAGVILAVSLVVCVGLRRDRTLAPLVNRRFSFAQTGVFLALAIAMPTAILTLNQSKSPIVGSICVAPLILLVALLAARTWERLARAPGSPGRRAAVALLAAFVIYTGAVYQITRLAPFDRPADEVRDLAQLTELYEEIYRCAGCQIDESAHLFADSPKDYLGLVSMQAFLFERHGTMLHGELLGCNSVLELPAEHLVGGLHKSNIALLTTPLPAEEVYPVTASVRAVRPVLQAICDQHFDLVKTIHVFGREIRLYVRR
jgi:hypothetical protein